MSHSAEVNELITQKAATDPAFKALLLQDAPAALKALGVTLPADVVVTVKEQDGKFSVSIAEESLSDELSDELLDQIAGGIMSDTGRRC